MNEITIHGNVTADLTLSFGRTGAGVAFTSFTVAVNRSYFDRTRNTRVDMPTVFHRVVAFGKLGRPRTVTVHPVGLPALHHRVVRPKVSRPDRGERR